VTKSCLNLHHTVTGADGLAALVRQDIRDLNLVIEYLGSGKIKQIFCLFSWMWLNTHRIASKTVSAYRHTGKAGVIKDLRRCKLAMSDLLTTIQVFPTPSPPHSSCSWSLLSVLCLVSRPLHIRLRFRFMFPALPSMVTPDLSSPLSLHLWACVMHALAFILMKARV